MVNRTAWADALHALRPLSPPRGWLVRSALPEMPADPSGRTTRFSPRFRFATESLPQGWKQTRIRRGSHGIQPRRSGHMSGRQGRHAPPCSPVTAGRSPSPKIRTAVRSSGDL
jgi:hypothetical protein